MNDFSPAGQFGELTLRDYLRLLRRQRWLVGGIFVAVIGAALIYTLITPTTYQSQASVLLRTPQNNPVFPTVGQSQLQQFIRTPAGEFAFVSSTSFQAEAEARVGTAATVTPGYDTNADTSSVEAQILTFRATASDPVVAQNAAQIWAELYIERRSESSALEIGAAIENITAQIERLEAEKAEIVAPLQPIDDLLLSESDPDTVARLTSQRLALQQALDDELLPVRFQLRTLSDDLGRLEIAAGLVDRSDISARINTAASVGNQIAPQPMRNLALGAVLGALLAVGAALLNDSLRVRLSGRDDIEQIIGELSILAEIPPLPPVDATAEQHVRRMARYGAEVERVVSSVAYQTSHRESCLRLMVTSPRLGEGKSTLVQQLAQRLSESHIDTIVLDADLRRPVLHGRFGVLDHPKGLRHLLADEEPLGPGLAQVPGTDRLRLLPAGPATDAAAPLLRRSFATAIESLDEHQGVLLVDSPPVLAVTDAEVMANSIDHIVVVVRANVTTRSELRETIERLTATRASILGVVLVGVEPADSSGYGYGYGYGYSASTRATGDSETGTDSGRPSGFDEESQPIVAAATSTAPPAPVARPAVAETAVDETAVAETHLAETPAPARQATASKATPAAVPAGPPAPSGEDLADVIPLWLESPKTAVEAETATTAFSEAAATGTDPSPRPSSSARPAAKRSSSPQAPTPPMPNAIARELAPLRNRRPTGRPRPRPQPRGEPTIDLR